MDNSRALSWKVSLIIIIIILGGLIFHESLMFLSGILGACTVYILVRNQMYYLTEQKRMRKVFAAIIILVEVILCVLIPAFLALWLLVNRINRIDFQPTVIIQTLQHLIDLVHQKAGYDVLSPENISTVTAGLSKLAQNILNQISSFVINSIVLVFVLYFMLLGGRKMERYIYESLPFSDRNKNEVVNSTKVMIRSNAIGVPLLAFIQGLVAMIGYMIFGAPDPVIFGFLTCFATILPLVGTALIWFPLALYLFLSGNVVGGVGLAIYALVVISNVDNVIRFMLQKKLADTHPLITVFGVIIGLTLFGFWGVIFGPLLLSMFIVCFDIYKRDYID